MMNRTNQLKTVKTAAVVFLLALACLPQRAESNHNPVTNTVLGLPGMTCSLIYGHIIRTR